jgi:5'-deoxynucleotidase YfbR-like HD superfamily hydrolase
MSQSAKNVYEAYLLFSTLSDTIRTGWKLWKVSKRRVESILEHTQKACILAITMYSEYKYEINLSKVIFMLTLHETEEIFIGDLTPYSGVEREEKIRIGHEAIIKVFSRLSRGIEYVTLIREFDDHETDEAEFAYMCDKLDADIQAKIYDDAGFGGVLQKAAPELQEDEELQKMSKHGAEQMHHYFFKYSKRREFYDEHFAEVANEFSANNTNDFIKWVKREKRRIVERMKNKKSVG